MGRLCLNLGHLKTYQQMYTTYIIFKNAKEEENLANILLVQLKKLLWNILEFDRIFYMHGQSWKNLEFEFSSLMLSGTHYFIIIIFFNFASKCGNQYEAVCMTPKYQIQSCVRLNSWYNRFSKKKKNSWYNLTKWCW